MSLKFWKIISTLMIFSLPIYTMYLFYIGVNENANIDLVFILFITSIIGLTIFRILLILNIKDC